MARTPIKGVLLAVGLLVGSTSAAFSSELTYQPVNPSFGGNPFNSSHLLGIANAQNKHTGGSSGRSRSGVSNSDLFVRQLQSRLLSSLATQVTDAIFGENPQDSGTIVFGEQTITFERGIDAVRLTVFDASTGATTEIEIPSLFVQ